MKALAAALILCLAAVPAAQASSPPKEKAETPMGTYIMIEPVALPIVSRGVLVNYVFVTMRVDAAAGSSGAVIDDLRAKEPYFRDALVRLAHRTSFAVPTNLASIDEPRLVAAFLTEARAIGGARAVAGVRVTNQTPKSTRMAASR